MENVLDKTQLAHKEFASELDKAFEPARSYEWAKKRKIEVPPVARFKMKIYFEGHNKVFYSFDYTGSGTKRIHDERKGLMQLFRLANNLKDPFKFIMIWASTDKVAYTGEKGNYNTEIARIGIYKRTRNSRISFNDEAQLMLDLLT